MKLNSRNLQKRRRVGNTQIVTAFLAVLLLLVPSNTFGVLNLWDAPQGLPDIDNRVGSVAPTVAQLARVNTLGAKADWNQFGTINTLVKQGGYITTGLTGEPVAAAREWVRVNRELFNLSETGVANLQLVNDGRMPYSNAHFVLFRQSFGGVAPTQDGQISVSIVDGKVFHVWSSSAGDQSAPAAATLTPQQGWLAAATSVAQTLPVAVGSITNVATDANNNWTLLQVAGFPQVQQVRLTALPQPSGGVRPAYESNVVYNFGHINVAYTVFVDAVTGSVLQRTNRVNYLNPPPETTTFSGEYQLGVYPCGGTTNNFTVPAGKTRITVQVSAAIATNDLKVHLLFNGGVVAEEDTGTSVEALNYTPAGGVPAGAYQVKICSTPNTMDVPQTAPFSYVGNFVTDDTATPTAAVPYPPKWKYFQANPDLNYSNTDIAKTGCWDTTTGFPGTPVPNCDLTRPEKNLAARAPWDYDFRAGTFTGTTRGNAAQTAESWGSPLTPSTPYSPTSASREYIYPWNNEWKTFGATGKGCDPRLAHPGDGTATHDADIDRAVTHLFVTHNRFHDFSYFLGFTEQNYNMQLDNFGNTDASKQNDPEIGNVQAGAVSGGANGMYMGRDNANQITLQDGTPGITNQYLFQPIAGAFYTPCADGDLDVGIVGHEYTHAITNRMIGGPDASITGHQGTSMGESWSDLVGAEYNNAYGYVPTNDENPAAVGIYATGNKMLAIRDYANAPNPLNYSNIGFDTPGPEFHSDGEPWNAVNWQIRQVLINKYNGQFPYSDQARQTACADGKFNPENCPGNRRWVQLMLDALLLQPASTSMLNARDAILAADVARFNGANQTELWNAFGSRGYGQLAATNGAADTAPIPDFSSPLASNATVTFDVKAQDEGNVSIPGAKVFVGHYEARSRPIADLDPATTVDAANSRTNINDNVAKFVPGTYDFVVQAPGYGAHRFTRTFAAGENTNLIFALPTNRASISKGATVTTTATVAADIAAKDGLIDDTEGTGARLGTVTAVGDDSMTVDLQGTAPVNVTSINVSTAAGPTNAGRFTGIRKFEILACNNGTCLLPTDFTVVYTSPDDAFPAQAPRPVQPQLIMRSFDIPDTMATQLKMRVVTTQCTGNSAFLGEQDDDPFNATDCAASANGVISRATEFQAFSSAPVIATPAGFECDTDRLGGIGIVDSLDVAQLRRFQLGFDRPYLTGEFQRADCYEPATRGDGYLDSFDVAQAQRIQLSLDPLLSVGGPTAPLGRDASQENSSESTANTKSSLNRSVIPIRKTKQNTISTSRKISVVSQDVAADQTVTVTLEADAVGDESVYGFSLNYASNVLTFVPGSVMIGSGATRQAGGMCSVLANPTAGSIGFSVDCNNSTITAGNNRPFVTLQFTVANDVSIEQIPLVFADSSANRSVASNPAAGAIQSLSPIFSDGFLNVAASQTASAATLISPTDNGGSSYAMGNLLNGIMTTALTNPFGLNNSAATQYWDFTAQQ